MHCEIAFEDATHFFHCSNFRTSTYCPFKMIFWQFSEQKLKEQRNIRDINRLHRPYKENTGSQITPSKQNFQHRPKSAARNALLKSDQQIHN